MIKVTDLKESDVGKIVWCRIGGKDCEARLQYEYNEWFLCQNDHEGLGCKNKLGYKYSYAISEIHGEYFTIHHFLPRTILDVQYGDKIKDKENEIRYVLARMNDCVLVSCVNNKYVTGGWNHVKELEEEGYTIVEDNKDKEIEDAIKLLEERGKIKYGKVIS